MRKFNTLASNRKTRANFRAADVIRPGGEAILLMGVAFGCVQLGWGAIFPEKRETAHAPAPSQDIDIAAKPLRSPFAPTASASADVASLHAAALAGMRVVGVRQAEFSENSGAVLAFPDGRQRPFLVGHEVADGIVLSRVEPGRVVLSFDGGEQELIVDGSANAGALALALMGQPSPTIGSYSNVAPPSLAASAPPDAPPAPPQIAAADVQWLADTMANVELRNGAPYAWRIASPPPRLAAAAGLHVGDLILAVNGNPPGGPGAVAAVMASPQIEIALERPSGERKLVKLAGGAPS